MTEAKRAAGEKNVLGPHVRIAQLALAAGVLESSKSISSRSSLAKGAVSSTSAVPSTSS